MSTLAGQGYLGTAGYSGDLGRIAIAAEENFTNTSARTGIRFEVTPTGSITSVEQMRLNGNGYLGLGNNIVASHKITIEVPNAGSADDGIDIERNNGTSVYGLRMKSTAGGYFRGSILGKGNGYAEQEIMSFPVDDGKLGDVGIGTTAPWSLLHVVGAASNPSLTNGTQSLQSWNYPSGSELDLTIQNGAPYTISLQTRYTLGAGTTYPLALNPLGGNIGIGTTTPDARLHLFQSNGADAVSAPIVMSRYWASTADTRAAAIFNYYNSATANDQLVFAVSGGGGSNNSPVSYTYAKMVVQGNGRVGIGSTAPTVALDVAGAICATGNVGGTSYTACSDKRYKKNITSLHYGLTDVMKLNPVNYYWRKDEFPEKSFTNTEQIGFIAQEIELIFPALVATDEKGFKSVDYSRLTPILVEAIKEQQSTIDSQQEAINSQQKTIDELKSNNQNLKTENTQHENRLQKIEQQLNELSGKTVQTKK